jgi:RimJ/RimL family protein N-acetyltransferase
MPGPVFARDGDLTLRTLERDDLEFLQRWQNSPELRDALGFTTPTTADGVEQQYERWTVEADDDLNLLVCLEHGAAPRGPLDTASGDAVEPVGHVALFDVDHDHGELAYWLVPDHHGMGYATRAVSLVLDHAFDTLACHRVVAKVFDYNDASQALLESLGFTREGRFREHVFRFGEYHDEHRFGLLAREWHERRD